MPRSLDPLFAAALQTNFYPFFALEITFVSQSFYLWSGAYPITFNGQTWQGTADLGKIASVSESGNVEAQGTSVTLSGINPAILQECLDDVRIGAPATTYFGAINPTTGQPLGSPCILFAGLVDAPQVRMSPGGDCSITVAIESHMIRLSSGSQRHMTQADQRLRFPTDTMMNRVESCSDLALRWGSS